MNYELGAVAAVLFSSCKGKASYQFQDRIMGFFCYLIRLSDKSTNFNPKRKFIKCGLT